VQRVLIYARSRSRKDPVPACCRVRKEPVYICGSICREPVPAGTGVRKDGSHTQQGPACKRNAADAAIEKPARFAPDRLSCSWRPSVHTRPSRRCPLSPRGRSGQLLPESAAAPFPSALWPRFTDAETDVAGQIFITGQGRLFSELIGSGREAV
jgi:hypothetical protein